MKFLLDTHIFIWCLQDNVYLTDSLRELIEESHHEIYVSAASIWEIAIKSSLNKLNLSVEIILQTLSESDYL